MVEKTVTKTEINNVRQPSNLIHDLINIVFGIIELILAIRLLLKVVGADTGITFVNKIYSITDVLISPFSGLVGEVAINGSRPNMIFEPAILIAIIVIGFIGWVILGIFGMNLVRRIERTEYTKTVD